MNWYKKAVSQMFSQWLAKEITSITGQYSRPYDRDRLPNIDYKKLEKWFGEERPDLNNMSLYEAIHKLKAIKENEKNKDI